MTTKPRNRVLTFAEAITQNQKTARVWLERRDNSSILAWFKMGGNLWQVIPYYNLGIGSFFCLSHHLRRKVAVLGERADAGGNAGHAVGGETQ